MNRLRLIFTRVIAALCCASGVLLGDSVETRDGARLVGKIILVTDSVIKLDTVYAGTVEIKKSEVIGFDTDGAVTVRLASGTTISGRISHSGDSVMRIDGDDGVLTTRMEKITQSWAVGTEDPVVVQLREEMEATRRKWSYELAFDVTGKKGNSEQFGTAMRGKAKLAGPDDALTFHGSYDRAKKDGDSTANEVKGGFDYTSFFREKLGWYARADMEFDEFEGIDFRVTTAGGLSYRVFRQEHHSLLAKAGFSYRFESFDDDTELASPGIDFGLEHFYRINSWGRLTTDIRFNPSIEDFSDFRLSQDTGFEIPIAGSKSWKLRMGISNFLNNNPAAGREKLDTTFYSRFLFSFD